MTTIGNITRVKWHYYLHGLGLGTYGHCRASYTPDEMYIITPHPHLKDAIIKEANDEMDENKNYAYVCIKNKEIFIRNLFNSSDPKGFSQKNTYFEDDCSYLFKLNDTNNILYEYMKKGHPNMTELIDSEIGNELYFCVEYDIEDGINKGLIDYMVLVDLKYNALESRLEKVEKEIYKKNEGLKKKSWF